MKVIRYAYGILLSSFRTDHDCQNMGGGGGNIYQEDNCYNDDENDQIVSVKKEKQLK